MPCACVGHSDHGADNGGALWVGNGTLKTPCVGLRQARFRHCKTDDKESQKYDRIKQHSFHERIPSVCNSIAISTPLPLLSCILCDPPSSAGYWPAHPIGQRVLHTDSHS